MKKFTVLEVCRAIGGCLQSGSDIAFTGISTDSRRIQQGQLFVPIVGPQFDGHDFIAQAVLNGAAGVLSSRAAGEVAPGVAIIRVADTLKAYQDIAAWYRSLFTIPIVAITGSNGKTTTKDFTAAVLGSRFSVLKTQANYNNEIGLPLTLLQLDDCHDAAVVEMGMRGLDEIKQLAQIARPTIGIITNVGQTHIELLGSLDNIAAAKAELAEQIPADGLLIVNGDDVYTRAMQAPSGARTVLYGLGEHCHIKAVNIVTTAQATSFDCYCFDRVLKADIPAIGRHNVYNALAAIAVGCQLGLTMSQIEIGLQAFQPSAMRLAIERRGCYHIINDAYNASPMSMAAAIDTLKDVAGGRSIAVLGDMLELGDVAVEAHCQVGCKLAESGIDAVVTVGEMAKYIADHADKSGVGLARACDDHQQAAQYLQTILKPGDTILLKGSRGMKMEKLLEQLM